MALDKASALALIGDTLLDGYKSERKNLDRIDKWYRWDHDKPHSPRTSTKEYKELSARSQTPWLGLVVTSVAQALYVEGYRAAREQDEARPWEWWQANGLDRRQIAVHRAALAYGYSFVTVIPGVDPLSGDDKPVIRGYSPRRMQAWWADPAGDEWPMYALEVEPTRIDGQAGYALRLWDDELVWTFQATDHGAPTYVTYEEHGTGVVPVVRFTNLLDLEGRQDGEVEPFIPVAARVDQTVFDRLVVQRFASWVVRTVSGMTPPEPLDGETAEQTKERAKLRLSMEDVLVASDADTKFGTLAATPLGGFIDAMDSDVRVLAAVTQTPPHHLLGQIANLSAEALAAAEASLSRKVEERKHSFGESWEQTLRLAAHVMGDPDAARDTNTQVRWRDMESRSLAQAADALGKLATMLGVPVEVLWEKIPGWTQQDVDRAKSLREQGDPLGQLLNQLGTGGEPATDTDDVDGIKAQADALGALIRAGATFESAANQVGLTDLVPSGAVPVSLRQPEAKADELEAT